MPKTDINRPLNCIVVHYSDFEGLTRQARPPVQLLCKQLIDKGITGQLWIYSNEDKDCEYLPDQIYKSIRQAANNGSYPYMQIGIHYGKSKNKLWGYIENFG